MEDPTLVKRGAFVNTLYLGADAELVETLVTEKLENAISEVEEIKELRSTSREGISTIAIELRDNVIESSKVWGRIRSKVDDAEKELPTGALKPEFDEMEFKAYGLLVGLEWNSDSQLNAAVLKRWGEELKDRVESLSGTEKCDLFGAPQEEILVTLDPDRLASLNLTVADVARQIAASDSKLAAGQIRGPTSELMLEIAGELKSVQRIEEIPIGIGNGEFALLRDIGGVRRSVVDPPSSLAVTSGRRAIVLGAYVRNETRIDLWQHQVGKLLEEFQNELPQGIALDPFFAQETYVSQRLSTLIQNLVLAGAAVFLVIFLLMGWQNAVVVACALPLAAMMVLFGMRLMDIPIHQMSVTGLIIALGLLIDNAIVIVDEISTRLREGASPSEAVAKGVQHLFLPLLGSTLTTAFAFAPIALMPGPAGEFVGSIAVNVVVAIFSSFFLAMTVIPAISAKLSAASKSVNSKGTVTRWWSDGFSNHRIASAYRSFIGYIFKRPWLGIGLGLILPIAGFVQSSKLQEQFFPPADRDQLHIELELSADGGIYTTLAETQRMRRVLMNDPNIERVDWFIGESAPAFYYNLIPRRRGISQYAQALVKLREADSLRQTIDRLQSQLDEEFAASRVLVRQLEQGPPFDAPVEIRLFGPDLERLRELGTEVRRLVADIPNVIHSRSELDETLHKLQLNVDEEEIRSAGISRAQVAQQLNATTEGLVGGSIIEETEQLPVRVRLTDNSRSSVEQLQGVSILDASQGQGAYRGIPLDAVTDQTLYPEYGAILHLAGQRMNEIQVYIKAGVLPSTVLTEFRNKLAQSDLEMPSGYALVFGGESAKRNEAINNLMANVGILLVMMLATLVLAFGSFRLASVVFGVGILSIGLGLGALWLYGFPFGFMAIVGSMGLMGVAINDSIVVLAAIRDDESASEGDVAAMVKVVNRATRHIISTSLTTMAGFIPLILAGGGFWPPMAVAIAGGVGGATLLALIFVPSVYLILMCWQVDCVRPAKGQPEPAPVMEGLVRPLNG